jgi:hypothetical protein
MAAARVRADSVRPLACYLIAVSLLPLEAGIAVRAVVDSACAVLPPLHQLLGSRLTITFTHLNHPISMKHLALLNLNFLIELDLGKFGAELIQGYAKTPC